MRLTGRCYCGQVHYEADGEPMLQAQCYCRECQFIAGGGPNNFLAMPKGSFQITKGALQGFMRDDIEPAATRLFCATCGTHVATQPPTWPAVIVKVGTLDDPSIFKPTIAIHTADRYQYHCIDPALKQFERLQR